MMRQMYKKFELGEREQSLIDRLSKRDGSNEAIIDLALDHYKDQIEFIGLNKVKDNLDTLITLKELLMERRKFGLVNPNEYFISAYTLLGNRGMGEVEVARLIGVILKYTGELSGGHLVTVSLDELSLCNCIADREKMNKIIEEAKGGVLLITDMHAYLNYDCDQYINVFEDIMDAYGRDMLAIFSSPEEVMKDLFLRRSDLKARINYSIEIPDHTSLDMEQTFAILCKKHNFSMSDELISLVHEHFLSVAKNKDSKKYNFYYLQELFNQTLYVMATRLAKCGKYTKEQLSILLPEDFRSAVESF